MTKVADDLREQIAAIVKLGKSKLVVLDDDPTGTQTVHDVPVYTTWSIEVLKEALSQNSSLFYVLTNSRSLVEEEARALAVEIGNNLRIAAETTNQTFRVVSRSDSTLRGHYPGEVDALLEGLQQKVDAHIIVPAFFEAGRETIEDVHYIHQGETYTPVNETPFARDKVFGYQHANLKSWLEEKTAGRIREADVLSISLETLREDGAEAVTKILLESNHKAVIVNATTYTDLDIFCLGLLEAEAQGKRYLYRTAASFVVSRAGLKKRELLRAEEFKLGPQRGGLVMVGSYVPLTTQQLAHLQSHVDIHSIELNVADLLKDNGVMVREAIREVNRWLEAAKDVVVYTSRELIETHGEKKHLAIGEAVSQSLVEILRGINVRPKYILAKGGITSSDLATKGLGVKKALVKGQLLPGIPVWELGEESKFPNLPYIVFPGNVGAEDALTQGVLELAEGRLK
jgi:uncharacterized protein YgbK (DUF1537 family)